MLHYITTVHFAIMQPTARTAAWSAWAGWAALPRDLLERRSGAGAGGGNGGGVIGGATLPRDLLERRRLRVSVHELAPRDWPALAVYTPDQIRHLIRLETALGRWPPTAPPGLWRGDARALEPGWRLPDAYKVPDPSWRLPDLIQNGRLDRGDGGGVGVGVGGAGAGGAGRGWEGAARGWAAGAVLLAVLLLLVRALERYLHRKLFKGQRRSSEEWPTPNVMATSCRFGDPVPGLDDSDTYQSENRPTSSNDLPPPYSECANNEETPNDDANKPIGIEEPPPPYSACYFTNPKDGIPTVHFYSKRRETLNNVERGQSSAESDAIPSISVADSREADKISNYDVSADNRELGNVNRRYEVISDDRVRDSSIIEVRSNPVEEAAARYRNNDHVVDVETGARERVLRV